MLHSWRLNGRNVPGLVKSIQRGTIAMVGVTSATATISNVDVNNTLVRWLGESGNDVSVNTTDRSYGSIALTNSTTVTASRTSVTNNLTVSFEVVEYWPGVIKSVQRGTVAASSSGVSATITSVDPARTTLEIIGRSGDGSNFAGAISVSEISLLNSTTVLGVSGLATGRVVSFQVVEWF